LKTALASVGAAVGVLFAGNAAYAKVASDPMVRDMENRSRKTSIGTHDEMSASLCDKASCNPGCQNGCSAGCQAACKTGKK
jgi:hypothetical protein